MSELVTIREIMESICTTHRQISHGWKVESVVGLGVSMLPATSPHLWLKLLIDSHAQIPAYLTKVV